MKTRVLVSMVGFVLACFCAIGQTYVNEMARSQVENDCYIEGGGVVYTDNGTFYNDLDFVQKAASDVPTAFIFNRDLFGNHNLTGFKINMLLRIGDLPEVWTKIEYSTDETQYFTVSDMHIDFSYDAAAGGGYWADVYYQAALPTGVKEIKVNLLAKPDDANWIPCYRRTEIFYETGTPYSYETPPNVVREAEEFSVDFENENQYIVGTSGSENPASSTEVVDNPLKDAVNGSDKVLKFTQVPSEPEVWGWGNGDWFGASIGVNNGSGENQTTKITENNKYLHFSIYRANNTRIGMETWGGGAGLKEQLDFSSTAGWKNMVMDLTSYIDKNFSSFYYSPNVLFQTNNIQETEVSYMDNIFLSGSPSNINIVNANEIRISGQKNAIQIQQAKGEIVSIYSVSGQLIKKIIIPSDNIQITVNQGYYLVKTAKGTVKTVVF